MVPKVIWLMEMTTKRTHSAVGTSRIRLPSWSEEEVQSIIGSLLEMSCKISVLQDLSRSCKDYAGTIV